MRRLSALDFPSLPGWWNGRHKGLKIPWAVTPVPVRVRPSALEVKDLQLPLSYCYQLQVLCGANLVHFPTCCANSAHPSQREAHHGYHRSASAPKGPRKLEGVGRTGGVCLTVSAPSPPP